MSWVGGLQEEDEWGFKFPERQEVNLKNRFPAAWRVISVEDEGALVTDEGLFAYDTIRPQDVIFSGGQGYFGKTVSFLPRSVVRKIVYRDKYLFVFIALLLIFSALTLSYIVALLNCSKKMPLRKLEFVASTDALTGLLNRRASLEQDRVSRYGGKFFVILRDIDHFKNINDTQGHDMGDHVLQAVASTIWQNIRTM